MASSSRPNRSDRSPAPSRRGSSDQDQLHIDDVDAHWLRVQWSISDKTRERAHSAMQRDLARRELILRLHRVSQDDAGPRARQHVSDVSVCEDSSEWYVRVPDEDSAWVLELGYVFGKDRFFSLIHSTPVTTRKRVTREGRTGSIEEGVKLLAELDNRDPPPLQAQAVFHLLGSTRPEARLTIDDEEIAVHAQSGKFEWSRNLSNGRIVLPVIATHEGQTRRGLLALDLNFHLLDPEPGNDD